MKDIDLWWIKVHLTDYLGHDVLPAAITVIACFCVYCLFPSFLAFACLKQDRVGFI